MRASCKIDKTAAVSDVGPEGASGTSPQPQRWQHDTCSHSSGNGWFCLRFPTWFSQADALCRFQLLATQWRVASAFKAAVRQGGSPTMSPRPRTATGPGESCLRPGSLADGGVPGAVCPMRSAKHRRTDASAPLRNGREPDPGVFRIPSRQANVPSFECRCRGNGIRERDLCGAGVCIWNSDPTHLCNGSDSIGSRTVSIDGRGPLVSEGTRWLPSYPQVSSERNL